VRITPLQAALEWRQVWQPEENAPKLPYGRDRAELRASAGDIVDVARIMAFSYDDPSSALKFHPRESPPIHDGFAQGERIMEVHQHRCSEAAAPNRLALLSKELVYCSTVMTVLSLVRGFPVRHLGSFLRVFRRWGKERLVALWRLSSR
jgi:hypothetical protein